MSLDESRRRLNLIRFRAQVAKAESKGQRLPEMVLRDEREETEEPLDLVDIFELGIGGRYG